MGRENRTVEKCFKNTEGDCKCFNVELFTWEKLDFVDKIKAKFKLSSI
jgi:S-adenosylmethionine synthetase